MKRLSPGVYVNETDDGTLHLAMGELLEAHGYADTAANRAQLVAAMKALLPEATIHEVDA